MKNRLVVASSEEWPARKEGRESVTIRDPCDGKTVLYLDYGGGYMKLHL